ncbi:MAG: SelL-related redox protein [Dehalococcoidia bacterium]
MPCQEHLREVQSVKDQFEARGVTIVVVSFAEPGRLDNYQQHHQWPFVLLADPDRTAYRYFKLKRLPWFRVFSPSTLWLYFKLLREGKKIQDYGKDDYFQAGGDFLLNRDGALIFAHRSHDPADRPPVSRLLEEVGRIKKQNYP